MKFVETKDRHLTLCNNSKIIKTAFLVFTNAYSIGLNLQTFSGNGDVPIFHILSTGQNKPMINPSTKQNKQMINPSTKQMINPPTKQNKTND
jgi:hypothetical protein